jgi:hypothetical protein
MRRFAGKEKMDQKFFFKGWHALWPDAHAKKLPRLPKRSPTFISFRLRATGKGGHHRHARNLSNQSRPSS